MNFGAVERLAKRPWASYAAVAIVQLKVVWGAWWYRDLSFGDTGAYFALARLWASDLKVHLAWSPLYTAFYGTLAAVLGGDAFRVTIVHRLVIVFAAAFLVLAVMRRLLEPGLALLVALWWAVLPVTFETMYEVHLFGTLPILLAWLVILGGPEPGRRGRRGAALAILVVGAVLVRNELVLGVLTLGALCVAAEIRIRRDHPPPLAAYGRAYGVPLAAAAIVCGAFLSRSALPIGEPSSAIKHTNNMCQTYAFGYQQRHPEWTRSPWTECSERMRIDFGQPMPAFGEMVRSNPRAVATHFAWNAGLVGNGIQLLLFDRTSGSVTPDYQPVRMRSPRAAALSVLAIGVLAAGAVAIRRMPRPERARWLAPRAWGWLAILALVPVWTAIVLTQRPRPSYLLAGGAASMAAIATAAQVSVWPWITRTLGRAGPWALIALVAALAVGRTPHYAPTGRRPLLDHYRRHVPFEARIARPGAVVLTSWAALEVQTFVGQQRPRVLEYAAVDGTGPDRLLAFLDEQHVDLFYADEPVLDPLRGSGVFAALLEALPERGWTSIGGGGPPGARWRMWQRAP